jgi:hypothetical protein
MLDQEAEPPEPELVQLFNREELGLLELPKVARLGTVTRSPEIKRVKDVAGKSLIEGHYCFLSTLWVKNLSEN